MLEVNRPPERLGVPPPGSGRADLSSLDRLPTWQALAGGEHDDSAGQGEAQDQIQDNPTSPSEDPDEQSMHGYLVRIEQEKVTVREYSLAERAEVEIEYFLDETSDPMLLEDLCRLKIGDEVMVIYRPCGDRRILTMLIGQEDVSMPF